MSGPIRIVSRQSGKTAEMLQLVEEWRQRGYLIEERVGAWLAWHPDSEMGRYLAGKAEPPPRGDDGGSVG